MEDPLERFRAGEDEQQDESSSGPERDLLLFVYSGVSYGIPAEAVDVVIAWDDPAPLPASLPGFAGVLQDRGRVVSVLASPLGRPVEGRVEARRIVICATARGFLGLPCTATREVGPVTLAATPTPGEVVDSSEGPIVYVDPEALLAELAIGA